MRVTYIKAFNDNYIWAMQSEDNRCIVFCPGDAAPVLAWLEEHNCTLAAILVTHHHYDHTDGIADLVAATQCRVYGPAAETIPCNSHPVHPGDTITPAPGFPNFQVIACPGHTLGHVAYYAAPRLFSGDTLFAAGCGRMFEGTPDMFVHSLDTFRALPADTKIYCAHEYTAANLEFALAVEPDNQDIQERAALVAKQRSNQEATVPSLLSIELKTNPFLRTHLPSVQKAAEQRAGRQITRKEEVFAVIREWKDTF
ncbi:hydroxyacylglutathione hydrolase [Aliidiomarina taiwanensis]|uniref:Hydroxyacylglutathione hydrolase n=1 Tax=Aliidiomarina taiwanensis TaxID=946228 RepID=A0A432X1L6_9GAMM|nr:hydroxyacylglutathione hydrolase [Aliidiomarina taiwanensis]RUO40497.1 hydroxyacylglutathione hydrolase [Aliidiomarina taiwanensis]